MKIICLIIIILTYIYELFLNIVDLKSVKNPIHEKVSDIYDEEKYLKWKKYKKDGIISDVIFSIIQFVLIIILLVFDVYSLIGNNVGNNPYVTTLVTLGLYIFVDFIITTIKEYVDTMVIEEKYGFNNTKLPLFIKDRIKSLILTSVILIGLMMLFVLIYKAIGNYVILVFVGILILIVLIVVVISPFLMKISYKVKPLEDGELKTKLTELLTKYGFKVRSIEVLLASERTTKSNASFSGLGKTKTITLYDNLINSMTPDEIVAVFAHELGHGLHKDTLKLGVMSVVNILLIVLSLVLLINIKEFHISFGFNDVNYGFSFILLTYLFLPFISIITGLVTNAISRKAEYEADNQAVNEGYGPELINALKVLAREDFADLSPSKLIVLLTYSHPPMLERILNIERQLNK